LDFSSAPPRMFTVQWPISFVVWSMSTAAPLRLSMSRIIAPCFPFSQPTYELGTTRASQELPLPAGPLAPRPPTAWANSAAMSEIAPCCMLARGAAEGVPGMSSAGPACCGPAISAAASGSTLESSKAMSSLACWTPSGVP